MSVVSVVVSVVENVAVSVAVSVDVSVVLVVNVERVVGKVVVIVVEEIVLVAVVDVAAVVVDVGGNRREEGEMEKLKWAVKTSAELEGLEFEDLDSWPVDKILHQLLRWGQGPPLR